MRSPKDSARGQKPNTHANIGRASDTNKLTNKANRLQNARSKNEGRKKFYQKSGYSKQENPKKQNSKRARKTKIRNSHDSWHELISQLSMQSQPG